MGLLICSRSDVLHLVRSCLLMPVNTLRINIATGMQRSDRELCWGTWVPALTLARTRSGAAVVFMHNTCHVCDVLVNACLSWLSAASSGCSRQEEEEQEEKEEGW